MSDFKSTKTVNFLEALEANKTSRTRIAGKVGELSWYAVGEMRTTQGYGVEAYESQWQIEPEFIEFECEWSQTNCIFRLNYPSTISKEVEKKIDSIKGKKARVRIEVL